MTFKRHWGFGLQRPGFPSLSVAAAAASYSDNVLALSPIAYWKMNETSGTAVTNYGSISSGDGTYSGVTLDSVASPITGDTAPLFDGVNDYCDIETASIISAVDVNEITVSLWAKVSGAGVWSDGTIRVAFVWLNNSTNQIYMYKTTTDNQIFIAHENANVAKSVTDTSLAGTTDWFHLAYTLSDTADEFKAFINGVQVGSTLNSISTGAWSPAAGRANIGANDNDPVGLVWDGYLSHVSIFDSALTAAQILTLATAI